MATKKPDPEPELTEDNVERAGAIVPIRLASLALAAKLDAAKLRSLKLERARILASDGEKSARLRGIEDVFDANVVNVKAGALDIARARVPPAKADNERAVVHGRVVDKSGGGVNSVTVTAHDSEGKTLATARSDDAGYYYLTLAPPAAGAKAKVSLRAEGASEQEHEIEVMPGLLALVEMLVRG